MNHVSDPPLNTEDALTFPPMVEQWPEADLRIEGLSGRILKGEHGWVIFMAADRDVVVPQHRHGAQWGVVLDGMMTLTVGDSTRSYRCGESHYIPEGVDHEATLYAGWRGLYVFERGGPPVIRPER